MQPQKLSVFFAGSSENFIEKLPVGDSDTKVVDFFT